MRNTKILKYKKFNKICNVYMFHCPKFLIVGYDGCIIPRFQPIYLQKDLFILSIRSNNFLKSYDIYNYLKCDYKSLTQNLLSEFL